VQTELLGPLFSQFAHRYTTDPQRFIAEGDHVVVEARGHVSDTQLIAAALEDPEAGSGDHLG
jgi:hypothetical protein